MAKTTKKKKSAKPRKARAKSKPARRTQAGKRGIKNRRSATSRSARKGKAKGAKKPARSASRPKGLLMRGKMQDKVNALITLGRARGYVTYDELLREFPTIEDNVILLENMYERFGTAGIDVLEGGGMLEDAGA